MEYVDGQPLPSLARDEKLSLPEILDLVIQVGQGLQAAHEHGVVHRDIKPENILVTSKRHVKITDFGLAKWKGATTLTKDGTRMGTAYYMSPEQAEGKRVDQRSDIFSLGVILYELVCHQRPFEGENESAVLYEVVSGQPSPLARYCREAPEELQHIVSKCLVKNPEERYQSAAELLADLKALRRTTTGAGGAPTSKSFTVTRSRKLAFAVVAGIALVAVAAALVTRHFLSAGSGKPSERKMLAVLPFENLGSPDQEYFADGITDEITGKLAAIRDLGVISRTSTMQYKKTTKNLREVAKELGVDYVLEGTILWDRSRDTSHVRILPQLIRVSDDTHLWAETYERPLTGIFALQADIASRIADAMNITLLGSEHAALEAMPTRNLDAYQAYLRGMDYRHGADRMSFRRTSAAVQMFQRAVDLDSTFAMAYAQLSRAHAGMFHARYDHTPARLTQAKAAADRALALQPDLSWGHLALCYYHYWGYWDYDRALEQLALAETGLPNDPEILSTRAFIWRRQGKFRAAVEQLERAFQLDPRAAGLALEIGGTYTRLRDYATAERFLGRCISLAPDQTAGYTFKALNYVRWRGDTSLARATLETCPSQDDDLARWAWLMLHGLERNYPKALDQLAHMSAGQFGYFPKTELAGFIYAGMGEPARARECFDSARVALEKDLKERPDDDRLHSQLGYAYAGLGQSTAAIREGKLGVELMPASKDAYLGPGAVEDLASIYVMVGEYDAALDKIEYLLSIPGNLSVSILRLDPRYDPLRKLPRFQKLLEQPDKVF
jgi:serine/threonine-protein kinase